MLQQKLPPYTSPAARDVGIPFIERASGVCSARPLDTGAVLLAARPSVSLFSFSLTSFFCLSVLRCCCSSCLYTVWRLLLRQRRGAHYSSFYSRLGFFFFLLLGQTSVLTSPAPGRLFFFYLWLRRPAGFLPGFSVSRVRRGVFEYRRIGRGQFFSFSYYFFFFFLAILYFWKTEHFADCVQNKKVISKKVCLYPV